MKKCTRCGKPIKRGKPNSGGVLCKECFEYINQLNVVFEEHPVNSEDSDRNI